MIEDTSDEISRKPGETKISKNTGWSGLLSAGQRLKVRGCTIADFVAFNANDFRDRFDQARTKTNQNSIFISVGHVLYTKSNRELLSIVEDTFNGTHDLQKGTCSRSVHELTYQKRSMAETFLREVSWDEIPSHGCWENLSAALEPYGIPPEDIPSPLNLFQNMSINVITGHMTNTTVRPNSETGAYVTFRAEIDSLIGISACPDVTVGGQDLFISYP